MLNKSGSEFVVVVLLDIGVVVNDRRGSKRSNSVKKGRDIIIFFDD